MYDTLMQMGRWFGYRQNYLDLCRVYTLQDIIQCFQQIATAEINIREQFNHMALLKMEPKDFGITVLEDPGMLMITNAGKRRDTMSIDESYAGRITQSTNFDISKRVLNQNKRVLGHLIINCNEEKKYKDIEKAKGNYHWENVSKGLVSEFLDSYIGAGEANLSNPKNIRKFLEKQEDHDLSKWDIVLVSKMGSEYNSTIGGLKIGKVNRKANKAIEKPKLSIGVLSSPTDEWLDFDASQRKECREDYVKMKEESGHPVKEEEKNKNPPGSHIRYHRNREKALLLIYSICSTNKELEYGLTKEEDIYGFVISFPSDNAESRFKTSTVRANLVYLKQWDIN